jgi:hypothetical protein
MIMHVLLLRSILQGSSTTHQEAIKQILSLKRVNVIFRDYLNLSAPNKRYSGIIQIAQTIAIFEVVLHENDMLRFLP